MNNLTEKLLESALNKIDELKKEQYTKYELKIIAHALNNLFVKYSNKRVEQIKNNSETIIQKQYIEDIGQLMNSVNAKINNGEFKQ